MGDDRKQKKKHTGRRSEKLVPCPDTNYEPGDNEAAPRNRPLNPWPDGPRPPQHFDVVGSEARASIGEIIARRARLDGFRIVGDNGRFAGESTGGPIVADGQLCWHWEYGRERLGLMNRRRTAWLPPEHDPDTPEGDQFGSGVVRERFGRALEAAEYLLAAWRKEGESIDVGRWEQSAGNRGERKREALRRAGGDVGIYRKLCKLAQRGERVLLLCDGRGVDQYVRWMTKPAGQDKQKQTHVWKPCILDGAGKPDRRPLPFALWPRPLQSGWVRAIARTALARGTRWLGDVPTIIALHPFAADWFSVPFEIDLEQTRVLTVDDLADKSTKKRGPKRWATNKPHKVA